MINLISVIINCHNGEKFLNRCLDSVLKQTYQNWEIIFWDNCSNDDSARISKTYDSKLRYFKVKKMFPLAQLESWQWKRL